MIEFTVRAEMIKFMLDLEITSSMEVKEMTILSQVMVTMICVASEEMTR